MADDAHLDVVIKAKVEGESSLKEIKDLLKDIRTQAIETNLALGRVKEALQNIENQARETNATLTTIAASTAATAMAMAALDKASNDAKTAQEATTASGQGFNLMATITTVAIWALVAVLVLLAPALLAIAGYIVVTTAYLVGMVVILAVFAAGLAGALILMAAFAGFAGAMGVAIVMLGERLHTTGKIASDPLLGLHHNLSRMADVWGTQALPMAREIIAWLNSLVPAITAAGTAMFSWFGSRLPDILSFASDMVHIFLKAWDQLGKALGPVFDQILKHKPELEELFTLMLHIAVEVIKPILEQLLKFQAWFTHELPQILPIVRTIMTQLGQAFDGLTTNLGHITDWFTKEMPKMAPIANQALGGIGTTIQVVGQAAAHLVEWFIQHWPEISRIANNVWTGIKEGWDLLSPVLTVLAKKAVEDLGAAFKKLDEHGDAVRSTMNLLGIVLAIVAGAILILVAFIGQLISFLVDVITKVQDAVTWFEKLLGLIDRTHKAASGPIVHFTDSGSGSLPTFAEGGTVPGPMGAATLAVVHGGERVIPVGGGGGDTDMTATNDLLACAVAYLATLVSNTSTRASFSTQAYGR